GKSFAKAQIAWRILSPSLADSFLSASSDSLSFSSASSSWSVIHSTGSILWRLFSQFNRMFGRAGTKAVMLDLNNRLPVQRRRVVEDVERRIRRGAVKHDVKPVVFAETFGGVVFV